MNLYIYHINLYDAALEGMLFIGLTFAVQLWFVKSTNRPANRFLALTLSAMAFWIAGLLGTDMKLWTLTPQFSLTFGPLVYFYVRKLIWQARQFHLKDLAHFWPVLLGHAIWLLGITPH